MKELIYNDILNNEIENGVTIAQKIKAVTCPLECSGNGKCLNGKSMKILRTAINKNCWFMNLKKKIVSSVI